MDLLRDEEKELLDALTCLPDNIEQLYLGSCPDMWANFDFGKSFLKLIMRQTCLKTLGLDNNNFKSLGSWGAGMYEGIGLRATHTAANAIAAVTVSKSINTIEKIEMNYNDLYDESLVKQIVWLIDDASNTLERIEIQDQSGQKIRVKVQLAQEDSPGQITVTNEETKEVLKQSETNRTKKIVIRHDMYS